ncbi:MmyB family transcriptional regulator [Mycolicibacterium diernhoferi]|uniref:MmyB family transcriptional regulator n=1 Tax=Mycolicibacterium diernhoferi TaxID=1801 RepID=UPI003557F7A0
MVAARGRSPPCADFRRWWAQHRVYQRTHGTKRLRHPVVGRFDVDYETFMTPGDPDQTLFVFTAEAGTRGRSLTLTVPADSGLDDRRDGVPGRPSGTTVRHR